MKGQDILYDTYKMRGKEGLRFGMIGWGYFFLLGMIFFQSLWVAIFSGFGSLWYLRSRQKALAEKRKKQLLLQFKEAMYALYSSLSAGRSVEQAFILSLGDLEILYDDHSDIIREWQGIADGLKTNETIDTLLMDFANRASLEDIHNFVSVFLLARRSGGDLLKIIKETNAVISEKIEVQQEIDILVSKRRYEQQVLSYIIPGMILFFTATSPEFLAPLYTSLQGRLIMLGALGMYLLSASLGRKIITIEV